MLGTSKKEQELVEFCRQFFNNLLIKDRTLIKPYELDIVIPELNLAIEFNGIWYHSIEAGTPLGYHLMKTELCEAQNYRLIHIWEDEWNEETKERLKQIFENKEVIEYSKPLDHSWFSILQIKNKSYKLSKPELVIRAGFSVENCGNIILSNVCEKF